MLSEYTSVDSARRGSPEKKSVSARWRRSVNGVAAQSGRVEVRFQGSSGDRQQLRARCQPAQDRRCCPWSGLRDTTLARLDDEMRDGETRTTAARAAELGEEVGNAHDAMCPSGFESLSGACPRGMEGSATGSDNNRRPEESEDEGRAATCDGLSRGDGWGW